MGFFSKLKKQEENAETIQDTQDKGGINIQNEETGNRKEENIAELVESEGELAIDVYQTDSDVVIQSAIAGVKPEDIDISFENDMLVIKGKRENETKEIGKNYFYQECYWGAFSRSILLPEEVDPNRIEAVIKNGILSIKLPKIQRSKLRKISVKPEDKKGLKKEPIKSEIEETEEES